MTKFIKVCVVIAVHRGHSNPVTSVIHVLYSSTHLMCICFRSSPSAIYAISPCSTSILLRPNPASPSRKIQDLWYTSAHVEKCTVSLVWDPDEAEGSIPDNTDVHFRPRGVSFRLFSLWPQGRLSS